MTFCSTFSLKHIGYKIGFLFSGTCSWNYWMEFDHLMINNSTVRIILRAVTVYLQLDFINVELILEKTVIFSVIIVVFYD